jgi:hypothetical protein
MTTPIFNYNEWSFWGAYNPPEYSGEQKVTFDGLNKLIIVNSGQTDLDFRVDVYSAWKEWVKQYTQSNAKYIEAITAIGGDDLPGSRQLGTTYFLENGWRMRTWEGDHNLTVTGNVFTREGENVFVPTLASWTIQITLNTSTLVETIIPTLSLGEADLSSIALAVWAEILSGDTAADRLININNTVNASNTVLNATEVWNYIIDNAKNQTAAAKLKQIATKTQDIALS